MRGKKVMTYTDLRASDVGLETIEGSLLVYTVFFAGHFHISIYVASFVQTAHA